MVRPSAAGGVIQNNSQVGLCGGIQTLLDGFPGGQAVAQADDCEVVGQRCAQKRRAAAGCRQTGNDLDFGQGAAAAQLVNERRHAVNAAVARADDGRLFAVCGKPQCQLTPFDLAGHAGGQEFFVRIAAPDQLHIHLIADNDVTASQGFVGPDSQIFGIARANAHNIQLIQSAPPDFLPRRRRSRRQSLFF